MRVLNKKKFIQRFHRDIRRIGTLIEEDNGINLRHIDDKQIATTIVRLIDIEISKKRVIKCQAIKQLYNISQDILSGVANDMFKSVYTNHDRIKKHYPKQFEGLNRHQVIDNMMKTFFGLLKVVFDMNITRACMRMGEEYYEWSYNNKEEVIYE